MPVADKVVVELELKDGQYLSRVRANERAFGTAMERTGDAAQRAEKRVQAASAGIAQSLRSAAGAIAAGVGVVAITNLADAYTRFTNQLKVAGLEGEQLASTQEALFQIAQKYGVTLESLGGLYGRTSQGAKELGATQADLLKFSTGVAAALKIQGGSAESTSGAILQLSQALGGAIVRAEEFNSINEGARPILQAVADNIDRFGGSVSKLRAEVIDGKVTSQEFFQAFLKGTEGLQDRAAKSILTIGASLQVLNNALGKYIGETDSSLSATQRFAQAIGLLADNLDVIIPAITGLVVLVGGRFAVAMGVAAVQTGIATANSIAYQLALARMAAAQTGATTAQVLLNAAMSANPIGIVVTAVAALAAGLFILAQRYNTTAVAARELDAVTSAADTAISDYAAAVLEAKNASGQERVELLAKAEALREVTRARIADARVAAQRQIDEAVAARGRADDAIRRSGATRASVGANAGSNAGAALVGGARSTAQGAIDLATRARAEADRAITALSGLERAAQAATAGVTGNGAPTPVTDDGKKKKDTGPSPEEIAARQEALLLQQELNLATAEGRRQDEERLRRQIEINDLAKAYADAQLVRTREQVEAEVDAILAGERAGKEAQEFAEIYRKQIEKEREELRAINEENERRLRFEIDLARLSGNDVRVIALERELSLLQRINELGPNRAGDAAIEEALLNNAEDQARFQERGADAARSFIDILRSDDIGAEIGNRFKEAAFDNLQQVLSTIFSSVLQNNGGGNIFGTIAGALGFGGGRAMGGPVRKGFAYDVGESGRERFVAPANGFIMPNMGGSAQRGGGSQRIDVRQTFVLEGVTGDAAIYANVQRLVAQGQRQTLAIVKDQAGNVQTENRLLRE